MLLSTGEKIHVMHRTFFDKATGRTLVGVVEACESGVVRVHGHIYEMDPARGVLLRQNGPVTRFISLVNGEHIVTPLPDSVALDSLAYTQDARDLQLTDGSKWEVQLGTLVLH